MTPAITRGRDRSALKLHRPPVPVASIARFTISGWPAQIAVWTAEEWSMLDDPPSDAQAVANGCRVALRID